MQKAMTMFKSVINGIETYFHFDSTCTTDIAKQALLEALKWIGQVEDSQAAMKAQAEAEAKAKANAEKPVTDESSHPMNPDPDIKPILDIP